jgi:hypothetical protein
MKKIKHSLNKKQQKKDIYNRNKKKPNTIEIKILKIDIKILKIEIKILIIEIKNTNTIEIKKY